MSQQLAISSMFSVLALASLCLVAGVDRAYAIERPHAVISAAR